MTNVNAFGTKLYVGGTAGTAIAQVKDIQPFALKRKMLDATNHDSTDGDPEFVPGNAESTQTKITINYDPANATHKNAVGGLLYMWKNRTGATVALTAGTAWWIGYAYVAEFTPKAPVDGLLTADVVLQHSGVITLP